MEGTEQNVQNTRFCAKRLRKHPLIKLFQNISLIFVEVQLFAAFACLLYLKKIEPMSKLSPTDVAGVAPNKGHVVWVILHRVFPPTAADPFSPAVASLQRPRPIP